MQVFVVTRDTECSDDILGVFSSLESAKRAAYVACKFEADLPHSYSSYHYDVHFGEMDKFGDSLQLLGYYRSYDYPRDEDGYMHPLDPKLEVPDIEWKEVC